MASHEQLLTIEIPLPPSAGRVTEDVRQRVRNAAAARLCSDGVITERQAREIMGLTRRQFQDVAGEYGLFLADVEDLDLGTAEAAAARAHPGA